MMVFCSQYSHLGEQHDFVIVNTQDLHKTRASSGSRATKMEGGNMSSAHSQVGALLSRIRHEFTVANPNDPDGTRNAAKALRAAFELLLDSPLAPSTTNPPASPTKAADSNFASQKEVKDVFLRSCFLPFASFLLREVGPRWMPIWDRVSTNSSKSNLLGSSPVVGAGGASNRQQECRETSDSDLSPLYMFDSFFRPPLVPASLALLALCEKLGKFPHTADGDNGGGAKSGANDARTVQLVCRLLEPYLEIASHQSSLQGGHNGNYQDTPLSSILDGRSSTVPGMLMSGHVRSSSDAPCSFFNQVMMELTCVKDSSLTKDGLGLEMGEIAERLAFALCLAPQRVANALGPIASPIFVPGVYFPVVCRAVVGSILVCIRSSTTTHPEDIGHFQDNVDTRDCDSRMDGIFRSGRVLFGHGAEHALRDAWRIFADRLIVAGRRSDLAGACLEAMVQGGLTAEAPSAGSNCGPNGDGKANEQTRYDPEARFEGVGSTPWEVWAEGQEPEVYAWLISEIRASRRRSFMEALLRSLWPPRQHHHKGSLDPWQPGFASAACRTFIGRPLLSSKPTARARVDELTRDDNHDVALFEESIRIVEDLLLRRPLPATAAKAIAETLAWCDRRAGAERHRDEPGEQLGKPMLMRTLKRVAAVWAEPSFVNSSSPRQQAFFSDFVLASLRCGGINGSALASDADALVLLVRGVSTHLDVPDKAVRLQGMRVGEAVSGLVGQDLQFAELDGERGDPEGSAKVGPSVQAAKSIEGSALEKQGAVEAAGSQGGDEEPVTRDKRRSRRRARPWTTSARASGRVDLDNSWRKAGSGALPGSIDDLGDTLDPDMPLPLGGSESDSDLESGEINGSMSGTAVGGGVGSDDELGVGRCDGTHASASEESSCSGDDDSWAGERTGDDDSLEAYDVWDDQGDLAKETDPIYLDQLIEMLRSRDQPETVDKHETALKCAEDLIRRNPPEIAHRAAELARDLLYLDNTFELPDFDRLRAGALVATTAAAPETCALYLGNELWGTGASEGTKLEILDVLVQAASELAGWKRSSDRRALAGADGDPRPSGLMAEPRGMTQRSSKLLVAASVGGHRKVDVDGVEESKAKKEEGAGENGTALGREGVLAEARTRRWGYRRGPREELRRNLFGRFAPVFFYPIAQGMILRLRECASRPSEEEGLYVLPGASPPPPPTPLFMAHLLHALTCLVELCGRCPATPALAADLLGLAWLLRVPAKENRSLQRAVLIALTTGVEHAQDGAASPTLQVEGGEFLRWLQSCVVASDKSVSELARAVLGHSSVQALTYM